MRQQRTKQMGGSDAEAHDAGRDFADGTLLSGAAPAMAAEVTSDRLINADKEPQNWLMNHRTYDAQRYSPLDRINTTTSRD